ncbi:hypothetical protein KDL01_19360 [Actinospica durhamensis]|uniref:Uncharacterized protein n=1 Tax=Actinospica durhamensis TaxID=1508375 RepID=A0A941EPC5_9ACTN|nr:hypothetical protein [Actinospica durhamensis]MBR7835442.1 hypothetical protein [Actinospica durhamensis]
MTYFYDYAAMNDLAAQLDGIAQRLDDAFGLLAAVGGDALPQPVAERLDTLGQDGRAAVTALTDGASDAADTLRGVAQAYQELSASLLRG